MKRGKRGKTIQHYTRARKENTQILHAFRALASVNFDVVTRTQQLASGRTTFPEKNSFSKLNFLLQ
jgi:hypothetical protein